MWQAITFIIEYDYNGYIDISWIETRSLSNELSYIYITNESIIQIWLLGNYIVYSPQILFLYIAYPSPL